ncbi:MAG TPA: hypothetical protein VHW01_02165 [Polyangiaceae bacterium]|nr:hypothetical protein [Polyangiaceae bacterium]
MDTPNSPDNCGHEAPPHRLCDLCEARGDAFLACSLACLDRHIAAAHAELAPEPSAVRARSYARALNRRFPDSWAGYAGHRERISALLSELPRGTELCVFGAGNCNDLELDQLAAWFSEIHLVDLDGEALERARDRQTAAVRAKIVLHPDVDFSGVIEHLDDWGERFPERTELGRTAVNAAQEIVRGLGRSFPATLSSCVLSQLAAPFQRAWITSRANWADLLSVVSAVHLATLAGATRAGGHGLLVFDTSSSKDTPELAELRGRSREELEAFIEQARAAGTLHLRNSPRELVAQLSAPGLKSLVAETSIGSPWLWQLGADTQLVYSLAFTHP